MAVGAPGASWIRPYTIGWMSVWITSTSVAPTRRNRPPAPPPAPPQPLTEPFRGPRDIRRELGLGRHARDARELQECVRTRLGGRLQRGLDGRIDGLGVRRRRGLGHVVSWVGRQQRVAGRATGSHDAIAVCRFGAVPGSRGRPRLARTRIATRAPRRA